jgi:hypothetical protein
VNRTRPRATSAEVRERLSALNSAHRRNLQAWGYPTEKLERVAALEDQADAVDALLAILTDRPGYVHDYGDLKKARLIRQTLGARLDPRQHLHARGRVSRFEYEGYFHGPPPGEKYTWKPMIVLVLSILAVLFGAAALMAAFK